MALYPPRVGMVESLASIFIPCIIKILTIQSFYFIIRLDLRTYEPGAYNSTGIHS